MKRIVRGLAVFVGVLIVIFMIMFIKMESEVKSLVFHEVDLSELADKVYWGKAETTFVKVEVQVEVKNHKIVRIDILKHDNALGAKAERITGEMINKNTYEVDSVSGATSSSQVIKSAVSNALANGKK